MEIETRPTLQREADAYRKIFNEIRSYEAAGRFGHSGWPSASADHEKSIAIRH